MVERLLYINKEIQVLELSGNVPQDKKLDDQDWDFLEEIITLLKPLKRSQSLLEGQHFVTVSFVPSMVEQMRKNFENISQDNQQRATVRSLASKMLVDFNERWGGDDDPVFSGDVSRIKGKGKRGYIL